MTIPDSVYIELLIFLDLLAKNPHACPPGLHEKREGCDPETPHDCMECARAEIGRLFRRLSEAGKGLTS